MIARFVFGALLAAIAAGTAIAGPPRFIGTGCEAGPFQFSRETWRLEDCAHVFPLVSHWS